MLKNLNKIFKHERDAASEREDRLQPSLLMFKYNQKIIWIILFLLLHL